MPDGRKIVAVGSGAVILFDTTSGHIRHLQQQDPTGFSMSKLAVSPNGRHIAYSFWTTIHILDASSGDMVTSVQQDGPVACIAYSRDGTRIASSTFRGTVSLWDAATGAAVEWHLSGSTDTLKLSFSADGSRIAAASEDGTIRVWRSSELMATLPMATLKHPSDGGRNPILRSMELSPDGMHIASGHDDGWLFIWDVSEARALHTFELWSYGIYDVAFSPSGRYVAAGAEDGEIGIWDVQGGGQVGVLTGDGMNIISLIFSPDGKRILSTANDWKVFLWDLSDCISESALL